VRSAPRAARPRLRPTWAPPRAPLGLYNGPSPLLGVSRLRSPRYSSPEACLVSPRRWTHTCRASTSEGPPSARLLSRCFADSVTNALASPRTVPTSHCCTHLCLRLQRVAPSVPPSRKYNRISARYSPLSFRCIADTTAASLNRTPSLRCRPLPQQTLFPPHVVSRSGIQSPVISIEHSTEE
jgi:hypothetical protein